MDSSSSDRNPVDELAEEFVERYRRGERPALTEYTERYPQWAEQIRALFPALVLMEKARPESAEASDADRRLRGGGPSLEQLGDYRILREVGRGGMGVVYEAVQESLGRHVALKVLAAHAVLDPRYLARFRREARAAARLHHTNIVPVHGVGDSDSVHYYVMQFIPGVGLDQVLTELKRLRRARHPSALESRANKASLPLSSTGQSPPRAVSKSGVSAVDVAQSLLTGPAPASDPESAPNGLAAGSQAAEWPEGEAALQATVSASSSGIRLPGQERGSSPSESGWQYWRSVARVGLQVADALAYASSQGVLHRDIKPSNLLLDPRGTVWVADFGLAKTAADEDSLTHTGDIVGTIRYMAPERFQGKADVRSDLYALGLTLYEMLTLRQAFPETNRDRLMAQVMNDEPPPPRKIDPTLPRDLETVVLKAMAREPGRRYQDPAALAEDLQRFLDDRPVRARRASRPEQVWRWCRRNPTLATLGVVLLVGFASVTGLWLRADRKKAEADRERVRAAQRQEEAEASFRQALDVVDRFCTDVSQNVLLHEPGMQPLRRKLLASAREYYELFVRQRTDEPNLRVELGKTYLRLARLVAEIDSQPAALPLYREAVASLEALNRDYPDVSAFRHQLARGYSDLAESLRVSDQTSEAEALYRKALAMEGELAAADPDNVAYTEALAGLNQGLGNLHAGLLKLTEAEAFLQRAVEQRRQLLHAQGAVGSRSQQNLARACEDLGHLYFTMGRMDRVGSLWDEAFAVRQRLLGEQPDSPHYVAELAASYADLGELYSRTTNLSQAEATLKKALTYLQPLARDNPRVTRYQSALGKTHTRLIAVYKETAQLAEAEREFEQARAIQQRLVDEFPGEGGFQLDLAATYHWMALVYRANKRFEEARKAFQEALTRSEALASAYPERADYENHLADAYNSFGTYCRAIDDQKEAGKAFNRAREVWLRLNAKRPGVLVRQKGLIMTTYNLGLVYKDLDQFDRAEKAFQEALQRGDELGRSAPWLPWVAVHRANTISNLGHVRRDAGKSEEALPYYTKAEDGLKEMLARDPRNAEARNGLRNVYWGRAQALGLLGRHAEALTDWDRTLEIERGFYRAQVRLLRAATQAQLGDHRAAVAVADELAGPSPPKGDVCRNRARVYALSSAAVLRDTQLAPAARTDLAARYADKAIALLKQAEAVGFFKDELKRRQFRKDETFGPLRDHADFKQWLAGLDERSRRNAK